MESGEPLASHGDAAPQPVKIEREGRGVRLQVVAPLRQASSPREAREFLDPIELQAPGDTRLTVETGRLVVTRFLADTQRVRVHDAASQLFKVMLQATQALAFVAQVEGEAAGAAVPAPVFDTSSMLAGVTANIWTVERPQPGWLGTDPAEPPALELVVGEWYLLLTRIDDWALVQADNGPAIYTDGRTLVPVTAEGAEQ